ncbi:hypothetical protein H072_725 [Dactylellina haptotyla CBS 200.50]|uniref:Uncharacterized protein n=1 Tax=Dactylellina haptotyla (strain CBS 200.50) TaxID=1284197 RepID=S8AWC8_DACHA|nr:hypothetical protein H072_725 [Dactylellina haptotyla CBS 200.50]
MSDPSLPDDETSRMRTGSTGGASTINSGPAAPDRLIVGVDFGTTYRHSRVAAVYTSTPEDVEVIKTWPGGNGITSDKVPTEISYLTPPGATNVQANKWGFQFKPEEERLRCIKLFLDRNQKLPHFVSPLETAAQLRKYNKNVVDAVSDYLTAIYKHTMDTLGRRYGDSFMQTTKVEFVLTVPAVWSDAAKNATLQAAERAGMGNRHDLRLISEPEAAAVYTLKAIQPNHLKVGDNFIVCDAGGGTVDLISYKITQIAPLRVEESAVGTGGLCGSAFLNYRFEDHVKSRVGASVYNAMKPRTRMMGLKYWDEYVKRNFNDEDQELPVPFPGLVDNEEAGVEGGFLVLTREHVRDIFEPIIKEVVELVEGQVETIRRKGGAIAGIVLVGGFGQSNYLYNRLKGHFNAAPPPYSERPTNHGIVEVMQPVYAWTAVVRGAVLRGLEGSMVVSRRSRWHYGTSYATVFDEEKHPISDRYWSPLWERWMVSDRMQWHIAKDEKVSERKAVSFHYTRNFRPGQSLVVEDDLIACDADTAPDSMKKGLINVCTLTTDLNAVPKSLFTRLTTSKGIEFDNLDFTLDMTIDSASLIFELKVDGVPYGKVVANSDAYYGGAGWRPPQGSGYQQSGVVPPSPSTYSPSYRAGGGAGGGAGGYDDYEPSSVGSSYYDPSAYGGGAPEYHYLSSSNQSQRASQPRSRNRSASHTTRDPAVAAAAPLPPRAASIQTQHAHQHHRSASFSSTSGARLNLHTQDGPVHSPRHPPPEDPWNANRSGRRSFTRDVSDRERDSVREKSRQKGGEFFPPGAAGRLSEIIPAPTPPVPDIFNKRERRASRRNRTSQTSVKSPLYEDYVSYTGESAFEEAAIPPPAPAPPSRPESVDPDEIKRRDKEKRREAREARAKEVREKLAKQDKKERKAKERESSFASEASDPYSYQPQSAATHYSTYDQSPYGSYTAPVDPYQTGSHGSQHGFPAAAYPYIPAEGYPPTETPFGFAEPAPPFAPAYAPTPPPPPTLTPSPLGTIKREGNSRVNSPRPNKIRTGSGSSELPRPRRGDSKGEEDYYGSVKGSDYETGGRKKSRPSKLSAVDAERYDGRYSPRPPFKRRGSGVPSERDLDRKDSLEIERRGTPKLKAIEAPPAPRHRRRRESESYHSHRDDGDSEGSTAPIAIPGGEPRRTRRSKTLPSLDTGRAYSPGNQGSIRRPPLKLLDKPGRRYSSNSSRPNSVADSYSRTPEELSEESESEESESVTGTDSEDDDGTVLGAPEAIKPSQISVKKGSGRSSRKESRGSPLAITWGGEDIDEKERRDREEEEVAKRKPRRGTTKRKKHQLSVETRADDEEPAEEEEKARKPRRSRKSKSSKSKSKRERTPEPINESAITEESEAPNDSQAVVSDTEEDKKEDSDSEKSIKVHSPSDSSAASRKSNRSPAVPERSASVSPNPAALLNIPTSVSRPPSSHGSRKRRRRRSSKKSPPQSPTSLSHSEPSVKAVESSESESGSDETSDAEKEVRQNSQALPIAIPGSAPRSRASTPARSPAKNKGTPLLRASTPVNIPRIPTPTGSATGSIRLAGAPRRPPKRSPISGISRALSPLAAAAATTALAGTEIEEALAKSREAAASEPSEKEESVKAAEEESSEESDSESSEKEDEKPAEAVTEDEEEDPAAEKPRDGPEIIELEPETPAAEEAAEESSEESSSGDEKYQSASEVEIEAEKPSVPEDFPAADQDEEAAAEEKAEAAPIIEEAAKSESESGSEESSSEEDEAESDKEHLAKTKSRKDDPLAFGSDKEAGDSSEESESDSEGSSSDSDTSSKSSKSVKDRSGSTRSNSVASATSSNMKRKDLSSSMTDPTSPTASSVRRGSIPEITARRGSDDEELVSPTTTTRDRDGDSPMTDMPDKSFESKAELIAAQLTGGAKDEFEDVVRKHKRDIESLRTACDEAIKERDKLSKKLDKVDRAYERKDNDLKDAKKAYEDLSRRVHDLREQHDMDVKRAIQVRDKDWDKTWTEKNKHLIRDLEAARSQRHSLEKIIAEKEEAVSDLEEQIQRLKRDISMSTRTEAQKTDDLFKQEFGDLWRHLQQWVFANFKGKISFEALPDNTKEILKEVTNGNPQLILTKRYFVISAVISKYLLDNLFNAYMYGMTKETNEGLAALEQYLASLSDAPSYDAAINRWRAQTLTMIRKHAMPSLGNGPIASVPNPSSTEAFLSTSLEDLLLHLTTTLAPLGLSTAADPREKLRGILETSAGLAIDLRVQRARFAVGPVNLLGEEFDAETMDDLDGHEDEDCHGRKVACVAWPSVWKSGDENGDNTHLRNMIYKAQVFLVD